MFPCNDLKEMVGLGLVLLYIEIREIGLPS